MVDLTNRFTAVSPLEACDAEIVVSQGGLIRIEAVKTFGLLRLQVFSRGGLSETSVAEQSGLPLPPAGKMSTTTDGFFCWAGPGEWVWAVPVGTETDRAESLFRNLNNLLSATTVVTDSWVLLRVAGRGVRQLLAMGSGVDYHPSVFKASHCVTTKLAGVAAMVLQPNEETFLVFVDRSRAQYLWTWLADAVTDVYHDTTGYLSGEK